MTASLASTTGTIWRSRAAAVLLAVLVWQVFWIMAAYSVTGGQEFADDAVAYRYYVDDPGMTISERHQSVFGAAVAPPLLPAELKLFHSFFASWGDFLAFRMTMLVHILVAYAAGFGVGFRYFGVPRSWRSWLRAALVAVVPVGWVTVLTSQDDSIAAAWSGLCLIAWATFGPVAAAFVAGLGVFFGKVLLALAFLALWIGEPRRRFAISVIGAAYLAALAGLVLWRDRGFQAFGAYVYGPHMGANICGILTLLGVDYDLHAARNVTGVITVLALAGFTWIAARRRLSTPSAVTAIHSLFLFTYFGAMPDYYVWFLPFLIVVLWTCSQQGLWTTFAAGWLSSFFAYGYKVVYGINSRFPSNKPRLRAWAAEHVPFDMDVLQLVIAIAAVVCTLLFAVCVTWRDPARGTAIEQPAAIR
jgi:hypothetical protein